MVDILNSYVNKNSLKSYDIENRYLIEYFKESDLEVDENILSKTKKEPMAPFLNPSHS